MTGRTVANWLQGLTLIALAVIWAQVPVAQAAPINLEQESTKIIGQLEDGTSVEPTSWTAIWWPQSDRPTCDAEVFGQQTAGSHIDFLRADANGAELAIPLATVNQFVCFRAATANGDWLYSDWFAVRVQVTDLVVNQRHRFVTVTASLSVVEDSWRGLISADDCPEPGAINQPLSSDLVRLSSDFQLVLEVPESADGQWLCVLAVDRGWSASAVSHHRLSRLTEDPPTVTIKQLGNRLQAAATTNWPQNDWYFFKSLNQPNCRANPIPESGSVTDPLFDEWSVGRESTVQVFGEDEEVWVCFMVLSSADEFGNQVVGYGLYKVVNKPATNFRGLIWLVALNGFIICAGSALGILFYRNHPD